MNLEMFPSDRITEKNYWCVSDEIFMMKIREKFDFWIERKNNLMRGKNFEDTREETDKNKLDDNCHNDDINSQNVRKIPKIFHFIWLGSTLPEECSVLISTWRKKHENWIFKLWTDDGKILSDIL